MFVRPEPLFHTDRAGPCDMLEIVLNLKKRDWYFIEYSVE